MPADDDVPADLPGPEAERSGFDEGLVRELVDGHDAMRFLELDGSVLVVETVDEVAAEQTLREWLGPAIDIYFQTFRREAGTIEWWDIDQTDRVLTVAWHDFRSARDAGVTVEDLGNALGLRLSFDIEGACRPAPSNRGPAIEFGWALVEFEQRVSVKLDSPYDGRKFVDLSQPKKKALPRGPRRAP